jgi:hypothetical protein
VMVVAIEQYNLCFETRESFCYFQSTESTSDNNDSRCAQVCDAGLCGNQSGHVVVTISENAR